MSTKPLITRPRTFASDNYAGICPAAWAALEKANQGHAPAYGEDRWTEEVSEKIREIFDYPCQVYFVFNGTAANSLALASLCQSYHSILCHEYAHIERDECGAPELFSNGSKVILLPGENGRIDPDSIHETVTKRNDVHYPKPKAVSLTQSTEFGTVYSVDHLLELQEMCRRHHLRTHMDGARFANAIAALDVAPKEITWKVGVDVLCFGGTKNGLPVGEAVVFFDSELSKEFDYRCKQAAQLASKMRFVSAPWLGLLNDDTWIANAKHANGIAKLLESKLREIEELNVLFPCEANAVFVEIPSASAQAMSELGWKFYNFIGAAGCRLMCSWDSTESDVEEFIDDLKSTLGKS